MSLCANVIRPIAYLRTVLIFLGPAIYCGFDSVRKEFEKYVKTGVSNIFKGSQTINKKQKCNSADTCNYISQMRVLQLLVNCNRVSSNKASITFKYC